MTNRPPVVNLTDLLSPYARRIEPALRAWLDDPTAPETLAEAMRYASLDGGKRLRPALVLMAAEATAERRLWPADPLASAVAIELVHCCSLVHDDLPAMDGDTLRRGRPTVHVRFGQAMAILVGDALLTRAFEVVALGLGNQQLVGPVVRELAAAAGPTGMIAGQVADMGLCPVPAGSDGLRYIHLRKTAAIIRSAVRMGGICAGADEPTLEALGQYGENLGLAFQVTDDLLDATSSREQLGKTPGKDAQTGKRSYATELGLPDTRRVIDELARQASSAVECLAPRSGKLQELALLLARRER